MTYQMKYLTIFTPTYNRAYLLPRLYNSLLAQKNKNFEWIIIDDESSDDTQNVVNAFLLNDNEFPIIFESQKHGGKHRAINRALEIAQGDFFFIVDSDDYIVENAVELLYKWSTEIQSEMVCGISGLKMLVTRNERICKSMQWKDKKYIVAGNLEREKYGLLGDMAEVYKTDIMRANRFPEFENEYFVTENVCWNAIAAKGYKLLWFNEVIYMCDYLKDGLTQNGANAIQGHINNYRGFIYYILENKTIKNSYNFTFDFLEYEKTARYLKKTYKERVNELGMHLPQYLLYRFVQVPVFFIFIKSKRLFQRLVYYVIQLIKSQMK